MSGITKGPTYVIGTENPQRMSPAQLMEELELVACALDRRILNFCPGHQSAAEEQERRTALRAEILCRMDA